MIALQTLAKNCNRERKPRLVKLTRFVRDGKTGRPLTDGKTGPPIVEDFWLNEKALHPHKPIVNLSRKHTRRVLRLQQIKS